MAMQTTESDWSGGEVGRLIREATSWADDHALWALGMANKYLWEKANGADLSVDVRAMLMAAGAMYSKAASAARYEPAEDGQPHPGQDAAVLLRLVEAADDLAARYGVPVGLAPLVKELGVGTG